MNTENQTLMKKNQEKRARKKEKANNIIRKFNPIIEISTWCLESEA